MSKSKLKKEDEREPWEMLENESPEVYEYFKYFLTLGPAAKVYQVAEKFEFSIDNAYTNSHEYNWIERKKAYQIHLNKLAQAEIEKTIKEMARRQSANAMLIESASMLAVKALLTKIQKEKSQGIDTFENMSVDQLLKWTMEAARIHPATVTSERMARGQATEINKTEMEISQVQVILPTMEEEQE